MSINPKRHQGIPLDALGSIQAVQPSLLASSSVDLVPAQVLVLARVLAWNLLNLLLRQVVVVALLLALALNLLLHLCVPTMHPARTRLRRSAGLHKRGCWGAFYMRRACTGKHGCDGHITLACTLCPTTERPPYAGISLCSHVWATHNSRT